MKLNEWNIYELRDVVLNNKKKIICYGAGMLGNHACEILYNFDLLKYVDFFVDGNEDLTGSYLNVCDKKFPIMNPIILQDIKYSEHILMITCECYSDILKMLFENNDISIMDCCIFTHINNEYIAQVCSEEKHDVLTIGNFFIPKIIHYCWFGGAGLPRKFVQNIEMWQKLCPDYEIKCWNESNYDISLNCYIKEAYEKGFYAFVSDYVRMDVIYKYGGIYFDTDVILKKNIDGLLKYQAFFTYGKWPAINSGSGFGAVKGHELIKEIRDNPRSHIHFYEGNRYNKKTNCFYETNILKKYGFKMDFSTQEKNGVIVLSPKWLPTATYLSEYKLDKNKCIGIHNDAGSWREL